MLEPSCVKLAWMPLSVNVLPETTKSEIVGGVVRLNFQARAAACCWNVLPVMKASVIVDGSEASNRNALAPSVSLTSLNVLLGDRQIVDRAGRVADMHVIVRVAADRVLSDRDSARNADDAAGSFAELHARRRGAVAVVVELTAVEREVGDADAMNAVVAAVGDVHLIERDIARVVSEIPAPVEFWIDAAGAVVAGPPSPVTISPPLDVRCC